MQQRRLRLGDILDDYCPRERRITNHVVVAMIEDEVKQTRCTTCDADHEYKQARVPASRRKKPPSVPGSVAGEAVRENAAPDAAGPLAEEMDADTAPPSEPIEATPEALSADAGDEAAPDLEDEGPVHRPLIRATLPRPEGQAPERKAPDFTMRQPGRFDQRGGQRQRGRPMRNAQKPSGGQTRFGGPRHGAGSGPQGQRHGNRSGNVSGQRSGRPQGSNRGPKQGGGHGRKRGR
ncbi:MAG TPA: hypothetical protein VFV95_11280 [Vicinamibacterales bacterium]|nr:hypothetical protein [Vicinamibacterales bacterium]